MLTEGICQEETFFVETYIFNNKRERFLYELANPSKRSGCVWRFAHRARDYLIPGSFGCGRYTQGKLIIGENNILNRFKNDDVYILSFDCNEDKKRMKFESAIDYYLGRGPYIMISCNLKWGLIETEPDCELHEYILLKQRK